MEVILLILLIIAVVVFYRVSRNKAKAAKRAKTEHAFDDSMSKQQESAKPAVEEKSDQPKIGEQKVTAQTVILHEHAEECYRDKQYTLALEYYEQVAATGHIESQMMCAQMYFQGQGCAADQKKALYWYEKASEQGHVLAQKNCGVMYKSGWGCTVDFEKALYWKEKAAEQGDDEVLFELGMMYELGQGCPIDYKKARLCYEKAAAQGNADAQRLLEGMR